MITTYVVQKQVGEKWEQMVSYVEDEETAKAVRNGYRKIARTSKSGNRFRLIKRMEMLIR